MAQVFVAGLVVGPYVAFNADPNLGLQDEGWGMLWLACAVGTGFLMQALWLKTERAIGNLATTIFIIFYAGGLAGFMTKMRMQFPGAEGIALLIFTIFIVKMTDTGAFFVGKLIGRHKMIPWLSPKKTWEGFVGGIAVAILCSVALGTYLQRAGLIPELPEGPLAYPWGLMIFGALMGVFSVAGDLSASLLKRDAAVSDSGRHTARPGRRAGRIRFPPDRRPACLVLLGPAGPDLRRTPRPDARPNVAPADHGGRWE